MISPPSRSIVLIDLMRQWLEAYFPFTAPYVSNELQFTLRGIFAGSPRASRQWIRSQRALLALANALKRRMIECGPEYSPRFVERSQKEGEAIECWRRGMAKYGAR